MTSNSKPESYIRKLHRISKFVKNSNKLQLVIIDGAIMQLRIKIATIAIVLNSFLTVG